MLDHMSRTLTLALILLSMFAAAETPATATFTADPELAAIVKDVSAERIAHTISTLAGFHTRHTLSDTKDPARGIGAARNWIKAEFESYSKDSGGRLKVEFDVFTAAANRRI